MDGKDKPLVAMLLGGFTYVIPAYQRNYDWKQEQCERLFDDLVALARKIGVKSNLKSVAVSLLSGRRRFGLVLIAARMLQRKDHWILFPLPMPRI